MKVLVLGGAGFIGSHLVDRLVTQGVSVRVFGREPSKVMTVGRGVEYVWGEFADTDKIRQSLEDVSTVIHLINATVPLTAALDPKNDVKQNLLPSINLLDAIVESGVKRFVYFSSGGTVYGIPDQVPIPETHPLRPINSYGIVKVATESFVQLFSRNYGTSSLIIRPSNPFGPRQKTVGLQGVIVTFLSRAYRGEPIEVWGDGTVVRDYIYIDDLIEFCVKAILSDQVGVFNVGSGVGRSINQVISSIEKTIGRKLDTLYTPVRKTDVPMSVLDVSVAKRNFDWDTKISMEEGIDITWQYMLSQGSM